MRERLALCALLAIALLPVASGCGASAPDLERAIRENERLKLLVEIKRSAPGTKMEGVTVRQPAVDPCPTDEAPEAVIPFGQPARTTEFRMSVVGVKECKRDEMMSLKPGEILLGVELLVEAIGSERVSAGHGDELVDADGRSYRTTYFSGDACGPALQLTSVPPGSRARGWRSFVVPKGAKGLILHHRLLFTFGKNNLIRFQLDR